ncbi:hypothetical protein Lepto7376_3080 [[Leptolyngbya] sp. PCC 7376]|nr:hypothetical protein Lepto7376_3080 [[Leptolyngbya] sp. PCC 7376]
MFGDRPSLVYRMSGDRLFIERFEQIIPVNREKLKLV